jgi:hypothetical protein
VLGSVLGRARALGRRAAARYISVSRLGSAWVGVGGGIGWAGAQGAQEGSMELLPRPAFAWQAKPVTG